MALVVKERVKETSTTSGTGTLTLAGAASGFQAFSAVGDGNTTYYAVIDGTNWEVGLGTYTSSGTTLARTTVLASTNSNNAVNFSSDSKDVFVVYPASKAIYGDAEGNVTIKATETGDDKPAVLLLQTGETDIAADDALGKVQFQAPDEAAGTDAILVAAEIAAVSEGDFSASSNATKLSFKTGASEAATEKMSLSSGGNLTVSGSVVTNSIIATADNITIDAQESNTDIIFKGTDGGVDTTFLTIDGSDAGRLHTNGGLNVASNLRIGGDGSTSYNHYFGRGWVRLGQNADGDELDQSGMGLAIYDDKTDGTTYTVIRVYNSSGGSPVWQNRLSNAVKSEIESNGDFQSATNSYGAVSDVNLKENIVDSGSQWTDIKNIRVRKFSFKEDNLDSPNMIGVIAQELESAGMSKLVKTHLETLPSEDSSGETPFLDSDGNQKSYKSAKYSVIHMKALKALQEAMAKIESLESEMTALKARVATLEAS